MAMRSARRATAVAILLILFLAPGAAQAAPVSWAWVSEISAETFLTKVWSLLTFWRADDGSAVSKNGGMSDPAGEPPPPGSSNSCDQGGMVDPAGDPCNG